MTPTQEINVPSHLIDKLTPLELAAFVYFKVESDGQDKVDRVRFRLGVTEATMELIVNELRKHIHISSTNVLLSKSWQSNFTKLPETVILTPPRVLCETQKPKAARKSPVWQPYFDRILEVFGQSQAYRANPSHSLWGRWRKAAKEFSVFVTESGEPLELDVINRCYKKCIDAKFTTFGPEALLNRLPEILKSDNTRKQIVDQIAMQSVEIPVVDGVPVDPFFAKRLKT